MPAVNLRRRPSPVGHLNKNYQQVNGFYVHSSPPKGNYRLLADFEDVTDLYVHTFPPRVIQMNPSLIRQWLRGGEIDQLEQVVLEGQGHKLIGEYSPDPRVRNFLKAIPNYMSKIAQLHQAVNKGNLSRLQNSVPENDPQMKNVILCKDLTGAGLLHKALYNDHADIVQWLINNHPETVKLKDRDGKTALHYCGASSNKEEVWHDLIKAGGDPNVVDSKGRTAAYYMEKPSAIELPEVKPPSGSLKRFTSGKEGLVVKPSNIRIWIHDRDLGRLQQVLWEGYGNKLRVETSNNPRVKRFLDGIPYAMNAIKDVHSAVIKNDYEEFVKKTSEPVPVQILGSKDTNGLNPLHKAAGLGRKTMVEDILEKNQKLVFSTDQEGRTPLHYAAWQRNNDYIYNLLVENGANEISFDNNGRLPSYYKANPKEPLGKLLTVVPDAPRTSVTFPPSWDWSLLQASRSALNIPQLVNTPALGMNPDKRSVSEYDMNSLRPPENNTPFECEKRVFPVTGRSVEEVKERIVKVEEKLFQDDVRNNPEVNTEEVEPETAEAETEAAESEDTENVETDEPNNEDSAEEQPEPAEEEKTEEVSPAEEEIVPDQAINLWTKNEEPRKPKEPSEPEEPEEESQEEPQADILILDNKESDPEENPATENEEEVPGNEVPGDENYDEKTEREIAEERQRMVDEGLIKVGCDDEEEEETEAEKEVNEIIRNGDMQGLADMVLRGDGEKLLGKTSSNSEIQGFLDNVPSYIAKIRAVHKAARSGELRDLQAALDRRRFAVAKDGTNSMGLTPLHVAVLFGRTPIIKYLGGRFPETLNTQDKKGRTPLHYAASLADNAHYFNILLNLGADRKIRDSENNMPAHYLENPGLLTQEMLLKEFNAPAQIAREMLTDKVEDDKVSSRRTLQGAEQIAMLNQCYKLIESAKKNGSEMPLAKILDRETFEKVKLRITKNDKNLLDVIWPGVTALRDEISEETPKVEDLELSDEFPSTKYESSTIFENLIMPKNMHNLGDQIPLHQSKTFFFPEKDLNGNFDCDNGGIVAPDAESYKVFEEIMIPIVKSIQGVDQLNQPETSFLPSEEFVPHEDKKFGELFDKTKRKMSKMMRHFRNEVLPVMQNPEVPPKCEEITKQESDMMKGIKRRMSRMIHGREEVKEPGNTRNNVSITIVNPDDETMEVIIEDRSQPEESDPKGLMTLMRDKMSRMIRSSREDLSRLNEIQIQFSGTTTVVMECSKLELSNVDPASKYVLAAKVECSRNLEKYQFPGSLAEEELDLVETQLRSALKYQSIIGAEKVSVNGGLVKSFSAKTEEDQYYTLGEILQGQSKVTTQLFGRDLLVPLIDAQGGTRHGLLFGQLWPRYRGVHISSDGNLAAWINVQEHLRIISCTPVESPGYIGEAYVRLARLVTSLDKHIKPRRTDELGFITSRPSCLGNTLRFQVLIRLPRLSGERKELLSDFCRIKGLLLSKMRDSNSIYKLRNRRCLGLTEHETYQNFSCAVARLVELEKDLAQEKSKQVTALIKSMLGSKKDLEKGLEVVQE